MRSDIEFRSEGDVLRGWLYRPEGDAPRWPCIVMAHGLSGVKEQTLDRYAEVFAGAGLGALVYDHANFGASDGSPRQEADPDLQRRGYRDAISFAQTLPWVDPGRIGIWGSSYSGGHVIQVAAVDRRVKCVVAQVPVVSGGRTIDRTTRADLLPAMLSRLEADRAARFRGEPPALLPAVSADPAGECVMPGPDAYAFFDSQRGAAPAWRNELTARSLELTAENEPGSFIARVSPTPLLMIVAEHDVLAAADISLEAFQRALPPKKLNLLEGGHFDPYVRRFEGTSGAARDWFREHLGVN